MCCHGGQPGDFSGSVNIYRSLLGLSILAPSTGARRCPVGNTDRGRRYLPLLSERQNAISYVIGALERNAWYGRENEPNLAEEMG